MSKISQSHSSSIADTNAQHYVIAALFQFVALDNPGALRQPLLQLCLDNKIKGTLILATEGINGTVAGTRYAITQLQKFLHADGRFDDLEYKESFDDCQPFLRMKVRIKREIVTLDIAGIDAVKHTGIEVHAEDWNTLITDPETVHIDTRNDYEVKIGTFQGAINPQTECFTEFPAWLEKNFGQDKSKPYAISCTGAIRCKKMSAYMVQNGYTNVHLLKGGILRYLEKIPQEQSLWQGECFVFDNRVAVTHNLAVGTYDQCYGCRAPLSVEDKQSPRYQEGIACHHCFDKKTAEDRQRYQERHNQVQRAKQHHRQHLGRD